jgi:beta-N-acetylhexosaminidase
MLSHIQYSALDDLWPASLSETVVKHLLRHRMGYQGLVMTDDLDMKAIDVPIDVSIERIMKADVDIALICHKGPAIEQAFKIFLAEIDRSDESRQASMKSLDRIMNLKKQYLNA